MTAVQPVWLRWIIVYASRMHILDFVSVVGSSIVMSRARAGIDPFTAVSACWVIRTRYGGEFKSLYGNSESSNSS